MTYRLLTALVAGLAIPGSASAFVAPLQSVDDTYFVAPTDVAELVSANIQVDRWLEGEALGLGEGWRVSAELAFRNHAHQDASIPIALVASDAFPTESALFIDGAPVALTTFDPGFDPANPNIVVDHALRAELELPSQQLVFVRAEFIITPEIDSAGQVTLRLPTEFLGMWEDAVDAAFIEVDLHERAVGLQTSLTGYHPLR